MVVGPAGDQVRVVHREHYFKGIPLLSFDGGFVHLEERLFDVLGTRLGENKMQNLEGLLPVLP
jgi:hypothetical protein